MNSRSLCRPVHTAINTYSNARPAIAIAYATLLSFSVGLLLAYPAIAQQQGEGRRRSLLADAKMDRTAHLVGRMILLHQQLLTDVSYETSFSTIPVKANMWELFVVVVVNDAIIIHLG